MLSIRPNCEHCDVDLPADSVQAKVCSFECTFCINCVENVLDSCCPNCGGDFQLRPIRPAINFKNGNYLGNHPAQIQRLHRRVDLKEHFKLLQIVSENLLKKA